MKLTALFLFAFLVPILSMAQGKGYETFIKYNNEDFVAFEKCTETYVVQNGNQKVDDELKRVLQENWKSTDLKFIDREDYKLRKEDASLSFIQLINFTATRDYEIVDNIFLILHMGGRKGSRNLFFPLAQFLIGHADYPIESYTHRLTTGVLGLQWMYKFNKSNEIKHGPEQKNAIKNIQHPKLKEVTLYLLDKDLSEKTNTIEKIKEIYPGEFKIVTEDEMEKLVKSKTENAAYVGVFGPKVTGRMSPGKALIYVYSMSTGENYFQGFHLVSPNPKYCTCILPVDLKKMGKF